MTERLILRTASAIEQNSAHHGSGNGEEMGSVLPVQFTGVYQAQINFLDQVRRLQRKSRPFVLQEMAGQAVQLSMHARN